MSVKDRIASLLEKVETKEDFSLQREQELATAVRVEGVLRGREEDGIVLQSGARFFVIREEDVSTIDEAPSQSHIREDELEVVVHVQPGSTVRVVAFVNVESLSTSVGEKPIVYDIPSRAPEFAVEGRPQQEAHVAWLERTGLSEFELSARPQTFRTTYYPTYRQTSRTSPSQTGTSNNDTQIDYSTDYVTDEFQDPSMDAD